MNDINLVLDITKMIRERRAASVDISQTFLIDLDSAKTIHNHLVIEISTPYRSKHVKQLNELTYSQECWINFIVKKFFHFRVDKLTKSISERINRRVSKSLISRIKNKIQNQTFTSLNGGNHLQQDLNMAGMDYLVDVETSELTDDIIFLKSCKYNFDVLSFRENLGNSRIILRKPGKSNIRPTIDYDIVIAMGKSSGKFHLLTEDSIGISHYSQLIENIKNRLLRQHKNHVTIVSEYSYKIQLALKHIARLFPEFTIQHLVIPPLLSHDSNPLDFVFTYIRERFVSYGCIHKKSVRKFFHELVDNIDTEIFEQEYELHIKRFYHYLPNSA